VPGCLVFLVAAIKMMRLLGGDPFQKNTCLQTAVISILVISGGTNGAKQIN
jgi:hypothetical protein